MANISKIISVIFLMLFVSLPVFAQEGWDAESFKGDTEFEFKYNLPVEADKKFIAAAKLVKKVYTRNMPKGKLSSHKLLNAINRIKNRGSVKSSLKRANKTLDSILNSSPDLYPQAYLIRGVSYMLLGKFSAALADFNSALLFGQSSSSARNGAFAVVSYVWKDLSKNQRAEWVGTIAGAIGENLVKSEQRSPHDYLLIVKLYYLAGELDKAFTIIQLGLQHDPADSDLLSAQSVIEKRLTISK